MVGEPGRESDM